MKALMVHGLAADPEMHWFQWLKDKLEKEGWQVEVPDFPTPEGQSLENWLEVLDEQVEMEVDSKTVLVGHSVGATFCLDLLDISELDVAGLYLVSGFIGKLGLGEDFDPLNESFAERNFNWEKIASSADEIEIFHGKNDPYVPLENAMNISENLQAPIHVFPDGKHLNQESGFTEFPLLLERLKTL